MCANGQGYGFLEGFNSTFPVSIPLPIANITNISICTVCPTEAKPMLQAGRSCFQFLGILFYYNVLVL